MVSWKNLDTLEAYQDLVNNKDNVVSLTEVMAGEKGAQRVAAYSIPMAEGLSFNYAAKKVDDALLGKLAALAKEAQLAEKFAELYTALSSIPVRSASSSISSREASSAMTSLRTA
jgi:glucose-6-phosphate isomerase